MLVLDAPDVESCDGAAVELSSFLRKVSGGISPNSGKVDVAIRSKVLNVAKEDASTLLREPFDLVLGNGQHSSEQETGPAQPFGAEVSTTVPIPITVVHSPRINT